MVEYRTVYEITGSIREKRDVLKEFNRLLEMLVKLHATVDCRVEQIHPDIFKIKCVADEMVFCAVEK